MKYEKMTKGELIAQIKLLELRLNDSGNRTMLNGVTGHAEVEESLEKINQTIEKCVEERTRSLLQKNLALEKKIEENRRAQEKLEKFAILFNNISDLAYICDTEGRILYLNGMFEKFSGHKPEEFIGKPFAPLFDKKNLSKAMNLYARTLQGESLQQEVCFKDTGVICEYKNMPLRNEKGDITGVIGIARDVTERKYLENELIKTSKSLEERVSQRTHMANKLQTHIRRQEVIANLGHQAMLSKNSTPLMNEAVRVVAEMLTSKYCKILELMPDGKSLLMRAGVGWESGVVGRVIVPAGLDSQAGYTLNSSRPVIVDDLRTETRFSGPALLHQHNVVSGMSVVIHGPKGPWGVIGVHTTRHMIFSGNDINFLQAVANLLSDAITRMEAERMLQKQKNALEQKNIALHEILGQIEIEKKQIKDNVMANAEYLLFPVIQKIKLTGESHKYVQLLEKNLEDLASSFGLKLTKKTARLTTKEIDICNLIKNGLATKEIAGLLHISSRTVERHRINIRTKFGIINKDINLSSYLKTL